MRLARQKDREERQAELLRIGEEEEQEQARAAERAERKLREEQQIKERYAQKQIHMQKVFSTTKTAKMGQQFLYSLGEQKGNAIIADNRL